MIEVYLIDEMIKNTDPIGRYENSSEMLEAPEIKALPQTTKVYVRPLDK